MSPTQQDEKESEEGGQRFRHSFFKMVRGPHIPDGFSTFMDQIPVAELGIEDGRETAPIIFKSQILRPSDLKRGIH